MYFIQRFMQYSSAPVVCVVCLHITRLRRVVGIFCVVLLIGSVFLLTLYR